MSSNVTTEAQISNQDVISDVFSEINERKQRENKLVIYGIPKKVST